MRPPEVRKYLFDIWQACELLAQFTTGKTLNDYQGVYAAVSSEVVWGIIEAYLPNLRLEIRRLLETAG